MEHSNYYNDRKYCTECEGYVSYLQSMETSYCVDCGGEVRLFSKDDWTEFSDSLKDRRPKGGRPAKKTGRESA